MRSNEEIFRLLFSTVLQYSTVYSHLSTVISQLAAEANPAADHRESKMVVRLGRSV